MRSLGKTNDAYTGRLTGPDIGKRPFSSRSRGRSQPVTGQQEAARRHAVKIVFLLLVLSLVEGPLRKWFLPAFSTPLVLLRDPVAIYLYFFCWLRGWVLRTNLSKLWFGFAGITIFVGFLQHLASGNGIFGWMLGVRYYWLYMPLAFVVPIVFRPPDFYRFIRWCLWICVPYAFLVAYQYSAPATSWVNVSIAGDGSTAEGLPGGIFRPFGLFTYTGPNVIFTTFMVAFLLSFVFGNASRGYGLGKKGLFLFAIGSMAVLTGSRGIYFQMAAILSFSAWGLIFAKAGTMKIRLLGGLGFFVGAGIFLLLIVYADMAAAMSARVEQAAQHEGPPANRAFGIATAFVRGFESARLLGEGVGAGAPGVTRFLGLPSGYLGENELYRVMNELGLILGPLFVVLRYGTAFYLAVLGLRMARRGVLLVLPLVGSVLLPISMDQITSSPLNSFLPWLTLGFILGIVRETGNRPSRQVRAS